MLETIGFALGGLLMDILGQKSATSMTATALSVAVAWQEAKVFDIPTQPDPMVETIVEDYLKRLVSLGYSRDRQGVWIQSEWAELAKHQDSIPASAASLTKIATTIAALETWDLNHRFETRIYQTGVIHNGILEGDLLVEGGGDPLFVWEEAIAIGNALNELGIRQIKGNLIVTSNFKMNFQSDPRKSGKLFKQGLDSRRWSSEVQKQYQTLPQGTSRPQIEIAGTIQVQPSIPDTAQLLLRHQSLTLTQLLKQMNIYSNNVMAEMLGESVGGAAVVSKIAARAANVSAEEIRLINASGLGVDNRLSPRAAGKMLIALDRKLDSQPRSVSDLFPLSGRDRHGTMQWRAIPSGVVIKTGTLAQVSALAGVIPTKERGLVWFAIINHGNNIERLRAEQDRLLQNLSRHWQIIPATTTIGTDNAYLGDPSRNLKDEG
ncbi:D-alanyl-D-alanine carboxypeptidase [Hydrococcus rivularis NIES-593]|uniref:D-alanyl-D-alanine carboxypeptidase n=1 Tax=Hydrococcus rivularis NIES-593 TaxID=1921803 RepID=A0A1U7HJK4_9CYAN|nr:D-alanyl-D-alanine carboxypeptidase [Hydrococcus rivularis]OKH23749.1 D-alanyl-D-alanine carboxypeptidase [Hydrococcus rivularis NIES-593]